MTAVQKTAAVMLAFEKVRPSDTIPVRINKLHQLAQQSAASAIEYAIAAGELLIETKKSVGHGGWLSWIQDNVLFSERTARNYMRVAREFPKLDDEERQRVADLSFRDTLSTLATDTNRLSKLPSAAKEISRKSSSSTSRDIPKRNKPQKRKKAKRPNTDSRSNGKASYSSSTEETEDEHTHRLELSQACYVLARAKISKTQLIERMPPQIRARLQEAITRSHRWLA